MEPVRSPVGSPRRKEIRHNSPEPAQTANARRTQISLLETGFSRKKSGTFKSQKSSENIAAKSSLERQNSVDFGRTKQPKLTNFVRHRSFIEPDSTTQIRQAEVDPPSTSTPTPLQAPSIGDLMVYVDVKIDGMVFRIPVLLSQVQTNTLGWLAEQAAHKYAR